MGLVPESGRSPAGGHDNTLQYSCLENHMDRGAWRATVHRLTQRGSRLKQPTTCVHWKVLFLPSSRQFPLPSNRKPFSCVCVCACVRVCVCVYSSSVRHFILPLFSLSENTRFLIFLFWVPPHSLTPAHDSFLDTKTRDHRQWEGGRGRGGWGGWWDPWSLCRGLGFRSSDHSRFLGWALHVCRKNSDVVRRVRPQLWI